MLVQYEINEDFLKNLSDEELLEFKKKMADGIVRQVKEGGKDFSITDKDKNKIVSFKQVRTYENLSTELERMQKAEKSEDERRQEIFDALFIIENTPKWNPGKNFEDLNADKLELVNVMQKYPAYKDGKFGTLSNKMAYNAAILDELRSNKIITKYSENPFTPDDKLFIEAIKDPQIQKDIKDVAIKIGIETLTKKIPFGKEFNITQEELKKQCVLALQTVQTVKKLLSKESEELQTKYLSLALKLLPQRIKTAPEYKEFFKDVPSFKEYDRRTTLLQKIKEKKNEIKTTKFSAAAKPITEEKSSLKSNDYERER